MRTRADAEERTARESARREILAEAIERAKRKHMTESPTKEQVRAFMRQPTDDEVQRHRGRCARWVHDFDAYNASIANALGTLDEHPSDTKGRDKELRQLQAILTRPNTAIALCLGEAGSGKALANGTEIPVNDSRGYVNIEDVRVGDEVFDENGNPTTVLGVFPQGELDAYRVTFGKGESVVCNDEHLWPYWTRQQHEYRTDNMSVAPLYRLIESGVTSQVDQRENRKKSYHYLIPNNGAVQRPEAELPIDPYALGLLIGDGCLSMRSGSRGKRHPLSFSSADEELVAELARLINAKSYARCSQYNYNWSFERSDFYPTAQSNARLIHINDFLMLYPHDGLECVFGQKSVNRRIPRKYLLASPDQRLALLQGLMDTDGNIQKNGRLNCTFSTSSEGLVKDVAELANSLGMRVSIWGRNRHRGNHDEYAVHFLIPIEQRRSLFRLSRKLRIFDEYVDTSHNGRKYQAVPLRNVENLHERMAMTCLYVDSPSHLFLCTRAHIVTHNTRLVEEFSKQANSGKLRTHSDNHRYMVMALRLGELSALPRNELQAALANIIPTLYDFEKRAELALNDISLKVILFIDEVHMMVTVFGQGTKIGGDVMKDMLARSPIRIIATTTRREYDSTIAVDKPLAERFKILELNEVSQDVVREIVDDWWASTAPDCPPLDADVRDYLIDANKVYRPDDAEPRKSLDTCEDLVSYCRRTGLPATREVVDDVFDERFSIKLGFHIDADKVYNNIASQVFGQPAALRSWRLLLHGLAFKTRQNSNRPIFSALLAGSSGSGKLVSNDEPVPTLPTRENGYAHVKRHGDLVAGDVVFDRAGRPTKVLATFQHKHHPMYDVIFSDGRRIRVGAEHLWTVYSSKQRYRVEKLHEPSTPYVMTTKQILDAGLWRKNSSRSKNTKWYIPMNGAVEWPEADLGCDPYVLGALIGDGCLRERALALSSADDFICERITNALGAKEWTSHKDNYTHYFLLPNAKQHDNVTRFQTNEVLSDAQELIDTYSVNRFIPEKYKHSSIKQRWELVRGLFDTDGSIVASHNRAPFVSFATASERLAHDVNDLLFSLGVSSTVGCYKRDREYRGNIRHEVDWQVSVKCAAEDAQNFFSLPRKVMKAQKCARMARSRARVKSFGFVGIKDMIFAGYDDAQCILVDNEEHLYQAGQYIVTHNTQTTKALAEALYPGEQVLYAINMPDYSQPKDEPLFRKELGETLRHRPNAVILLDEFEKAAENIRRSMLYILDEGLVNFTVINREGREETNTASLRNAIVICTTNQGSDVFKNDAQFSVISNDFSDDGVGELTLEQEMAMVQLSQDLRANLEGNGFPPELLGRFDEIMLYRALSAKTTLKIVRVKLDAMLDDLKRFHGITIDLNPEVTWDAAQYDCFANDVCVYIAFVCAKVDVRDSNAGGARRLDSELQTNVFYRIVQACSNNPECKHFKLGVRGAFKIERGDGYVTWELDNEVKEGIYLEPVIDDVDSDATN